MPDDPAQEPMGELERLACARFPDLSAAEIELVRAAPAGEVAVCGPKAKPDDPAYDPSKAEDWGPEREIRAELIRWLCMDPRTKKLVDPRGIHVLGAKISDSLDLDNVTIPFRLSLQRCWLAQKLNLRGARLPVLNLQGTRVHAIGADGVVVKGAVFLRDGFRAEGEVRLLDAQIGGTLDCRAATLGYPPQAVATGSHHVLSADRAVVKGSVFLNSRFNAKGQVEVRFSANGEVRLLGTKIGGNLSCNGATFENLVQADATVSGTALRADGAVVKGSVFLSDGLSAKGAVRLLGAHIGGALLCIGAKANLTLIAETAVIKGTLFWAGIDPKETMLNLTNASAGALADEVGSWPATGNLFLDGFAYGRFSGSAPKDATSRLEWLARQEPFAPQPYRQLAKVLRDEGDDAGARRVLSKMEDRRRAKEDPWYVRPWGWLLKGTIGYGYYPVRALLWLLVFVLLGRPLYRHAYFSGNIAPTDKDAYSSFQKDHHPPAYYEPFCASIYSLEKTFPFAKLGQVDRWQPDPNPPPPNLATVSRSHRFIRWFISARFLRGFGWLQTALGWILATLFAAGVTGVIRKDKD